MPTVLERTDKSYKVLTFKFFAMNYEDDNDILFRGKLCWFILDSYPFGLRTRVKQVSIKYFGYNYLTKFQITRQRIGLRGLEL